MLHRLKIGDHLVCVRTGKLSMEVKGETVGAVGVDQFCYGASFGLPHDFAVRSLELFITEVMPHFASQPADANP